MMWKALLLAGVLAGAMVEASEVCFYKSDSVSGLNRICLYTCPSGNASITVKSSQICPIQIKR